jgi:hypothetical protein
MKRRTIVTIVGAAVLACGITGAAVAVAAGGGGDDEGHVTGPDADRAVAAALAETGATKANVVERDSENGAVWEVEVTRADGSQADVRLDADMHVVVVESDSESR